MAAIACIFLYNLIKKILANENKISEGLKLKIALIIKMNIIHL